MKRIQLRPLLSAIAVLIAIHLPSTVMAQYVWLDEKGSKQYSDIPPPPSVPASRILKQPNGARPLPPAPQESSGSQDTSSPSPKVELSIAEKNAEFRKRKSEQAEKEKKAEEEAKRAADKAKNCERARDYHRALESGQRIAHTDKNGERTFLSDEQRAQELRDARRILEDCKR